MTPNEGVGADSTFREAWAAQVAWGQHAQQHPCGCSLSGGAICPLGASLYTAAMRTANAANGALGTPKNGRRPGDG